MRTEERRRFLFASPCVGRPCIAGCRRLAFVGCGFLQRGFGGSGLKSAAGSRHLDEWHEEPDPNDVVLLRCRCLIPTKVARCHAEKVAKCHAAKVVRCHAETVAGITPRSRREVRRSGPRARPRRCLGPLRWTDESVSAMAVALTASILSQCWPARFTHNGYEQKWLWMRVGVMDGPWMSVVCLLMLLSSGCIGWLCGIHAPIQGQ